MGKKVLTMITRHGSDEKNITGYTLISSDYQTVTVTTQQLIDALKNKKVEVTNLELKAGKIESTNGAANNYTLINNQSGAVIGSPKAVILDRVESNGKLVGYTVFSTLGSLAEINIADAVALTNNKLIANGKIRHTQDGDIVASIGGNYPLREVEMTKAPKGETTVSVVYFSTVGKFGYAGAIVSSTSAASMSEIRAKLIESNTEVIANSKKLGNKNTDSLNIQRAGATTEFAVITLPELNKLVKAGAKLAFIGDSVIISAIKYEDGESYEATVSINKNLNICDEHKSDIKGLNDDLKTYTKQILSYLKSNM